MDNNSIIDSESDGKLFDWDDMSDCNYSETSSTASETSKVDRIAELNRNLAAISKEAQASRDKNRGLKHTLRDLMERYKQMEDIYEQIGVKMEPQLIVLENEILKVQPILSMGQTMLKNLQEYIEYKSIKLQLLDLDAEEMETESSPNNLTINYPTEEQILTELMGRVSLEKSNANLTEYFNLEEKQSDYKKLMEGGIRHYNEMQKRFSSSKEGNVTECITIPDTQPFNVNF
ncbi:uncharacterized protein LOC107371816 [Tetranychus urticae]|uniref:Uncharacterized protein n=1 Tax=Tetranychus urticae TaxID=32264 RepID=T1JUT2_TETUR|nr:uncharacterized protein LOC107371816 [Tetranychus urticae]